MSRINTRRPSSSKRSTFRRRDGDFETQLQVVVSPEDDVEVRRLSITNRGDRPREIEVTSYAEIVLARPEDDLAHPAFAKLFIETEYDAQSAGLLFSRRPRSAEEPPAPGRFTCSPSTAGSAAPSNGRPIARGSSAGDGRRQTRWRSTAARCRAQPARCSIRWPAVRERVRLAPGAFVRVTFATGVAQDRPSALALVRKYRDASAAARAFSMASTHAHITLQHLGLTDDHAMLFDRLASRVFGSDASCTSPDDIARNIVRPVQSVGLRQSRATCRSCSCTWRTPTRSRWCGSCCTRRSTGGSRIFARTW